MKQPTVCLAMIVAGANKNEAKQLDTCLSNISSHIDSIYLNINHPQDKTVAKEVIAVAKKYKATYFITEWHDNFVEARNFIFDKVPKDYEFILWLDTDDTVDKPEEIHKIAAIVSKNQHGVYANYEYSHDEFGNITTIHYVARLVRNDGSYRWKSSIDDEGISVHETLNEVIPRGKAVCDDFRVIHHADHERQFSSLQRNIKMLEAMFDRQTSNGKIDPRTLFYLATHYFDAGNYRRTKELLNEYMQMSGWAEERCEALIYLGKIYTLEGKVDNAHHAYLLALGEYQNSPRPYIELSKIDFLNKRFQESADWIEKCLALPKASTTMVVRPMENTFDAYMLAAQANVNLGGKKLDIAKKYVYKALKLRPLDKDAQSSRDLIEELVNKRENIRAAIRIVNNFDDKSKIVPFLNSLPLEIQDNPLILNTRFANSKPREWGEKEIAIYVGQGPLGIWGPWSLKDGIGGSEEAVVKLSRELAKLGWKVTIYATPGDKPGLDMGVNDGYATWKQYYEFNPKDNFNILVGWRQPSFFDYDIKSKKRYLWLHDVMPKEEFTQERLDRVDKVIFVGKYHASLYEGVIPEDKWFISGNGIDPSDFEKADGKFKRQPHRMIYMSSYERGLQILLDNWDKIKKAVPDATLDVYYGWNSFDAILRDNPERQSWKKSMQTKMQLSQGITDHGRIGHYQIIEEISKADIFAFPCVFPEVYCISYVKAMAGGAIPVTTDYAEIGNYDGYQTHYDGLHPTLMEEEYINSLIKHLKKNHADSERQKLIDYARKNYSWGATAKGWSDEFKR